MFLVCPVCSPMAHLVGGRCRPAKRPASVLCRGLLPRSCAAWFCGKLPLLQASGELPPARLRQILESPSPLDLSRHPKTPLSNNVQRRSDSSSEMGVDQSSSPPAGMRGSSPRACTTRLRPARRARLPSSHAFRRLSPAPATPSPRSPSR